MMADQRKSVDKSRSPLKTKYVRSQKIMQPSPTETRSEDIPEDADPIQAKAPSRSHTPGHLSTKSSDKRKGSTSKESRSRSHSQSQSSTKSPVVAAPIPKLPSQMNESNGSVTSPTGPEGSPAAPASLAAIDRRPVVLRSTSAIAAKSISSSVTSVSAPKAPVQSKKIGTHTFFPPPPETKEDHDMLPAPASGMYWSRAPTSGAPHTALRAHTTTSIGSNIYIFGGCDSRSCFDEVYVFDADAFYWSSPLVTGDIPVPLRAMTCTAVGKKLVVFGGGDGPVYYNDIYVLDTVNFRWTKPVITGTLPSKRRAHTACLYRNGIYIFGGGDGVRALNDVWRLDVSDMTKMSWKLISTPSGSSAPSPTGDRRDTKEAAKLRAGRDVKPKARGYHTANMVGSKLIVFGGSDGGECFRDVWVFDVDTLIWKPVHIPVSYPRLSHTATIVGSYLFVIGGHDGVEYSNEVMLLNLVNMQWDKRIIYGEPPSGRGYHGTVLHDSRLFVIGGFDGVTVFGDVFVLELAVHAYYSQISHYTIDV